MNIAMKNAKQKKRRTPQQMLLAGVMLFFFTAFLLLFVQSPSLLTAAMALRVPLAVWASCPGFSPWMSFCLRSSHFCARWACCCNTATPPRAG